METYSDHKQLKTALKRLKPFTESKPNLQILKYTRLDIQDGTLTFTVGTYEYGKTVSFTSASVPAGQDNYRVLVKYADLRKVIDKCKADVQFTVTEGNSLKLQAGNLSFNLKGKDASEFPETPDMRNDMQVSTAISYGDIRTELEFVNSATDCYKPVNYTSGVLFDYCDTDRLRLIGTDGRRLHSTFTTSRCHTVGDDHNRWLVPVTWVDAFNRLKVPTDETVYFEFYGDDHLQWRIPTQGLSGTVSLLDYPYPEYEKVIPDDCESRFQLDTKATLESLNAVSIIANELDGRDMVVVNVNGTLSLSANAESMGKATAEVPCTHLEGPEATFALNVNYFIETLKLAGKEITMSNSGSLEPARFDYPDTNRIAVVMPVRLPE